MQWIISSIDICQYKYYYFDMPNQRLRTTLQTPTHNYIIPYTTHRHTYNAYPNEYQSPYKAFTYKN